MRVLFATSEFDPLIKTGGLADVSAALPAALGREGHAVTVMLPGYRTLRAARGTTREIARFDLSGEAVEIRAGRYRGTDVWYVDAARRFDRDGSAYTDPFGHDWGDNAERFATFCRAVVAVTGAAAARGVPFDVLHLNDWQTGLAAPLARQLARPPRIVFSVHNLAYQGRFDRDAFARLHLPWQWWSPDALEFHGDWSFLKGGLAFADAITTVSPTYAREIQTPAHGEGLDGLLRHRRASLHGIVNGIDTCVWDPAWDAHIVQRFSREDVTGRWVNKLALQRELGLAVDRAVPLAVTVTRLAHQKGVDLLLAALPRILDAGAQVAVLGRGDAHYEGALAAEAERNSGRVAFVGRLDEGLAHRFEAGADLFMMPSRYEPCGLNQMYSQRYGCIPLVRRTGGLADTVLPFAEHGRAATGFAFDDATPQALADCAIAAIAAYRDVEAWQQLVRNAMERDFSWQGSAARYGEIYRGESARV